MAIENLPGGGLKIIHDEKGVLFEMIETEVVTDEGTPFVAIYATDYMRDEGTISLNGQELDALIENLVQLRKLI